MTSAGGIRAGRAYVEAYLDKSKLEEGFKNVKAQLDSFAKHVAIVGGGLTAIGASIVGPMTLAVKHFAAAGDKLDKMSSRTGVAVETLSALEFVASQTGSSIDVLEKGFAGLSRTFFEAKRGAGAAVDALAELGLSISDLDRLSPDEQFLEIATAIEKLENESIRGAVAQKIFGRAGRELLPMLRGAKGGIESLMEKAKELGIVMSTEDSKAAAEMTDAMDVLNRSIVSVKLALGRDLIPMALKLVNRLVEVVQHVRTWVSEHPVLIQWLAKLGLALSVVGAAMLALAAAAKATVIAKAAVLALSGPAGLLALAAGTVAVGVAVNELNSLLDDSASSVDALAKAAGGAGDDFEKLADAAENTAKKIKELEKRQLELMGQSFRQSGLIGSFNDKKELEAIGEQLKKLKALRDEIAAKTPKEKPEQTHEEMKAAARKEMLAEETAEFRESFGKLKDELESAASGLFPGQKLDEELRRISGLKDQLQRSEELGIAAPGESERMKPLFKKMEDAAFEEFNKPAKEAEEKEEQRKESIAGILGRLEDSLLEPLDRQVKETVEALKELGATPKEIESAKKLIGESLKEDEKKEARDSFSAPGGTFSAMASQMFSTGPIDQLVEHSKTTAKNTGKIVQNTRVGITFKD
jgi:hypothetical protein